MELNDNQRRMLEGEEGKNIRKAMELLVAYGRCYDAGRLIPVTSVHIAGNFPVLMDEGVEWLEELAEAGTRMRVFTTKNPEMYDPEQADEMRVPSGIREKQTRIDNALRRLGVVPTYTCQHYLVGNVPRFKDHIAWASSGSQVFANSVIGARSNRDGDHVALTSAITGVIPDWGLHMEKNRKADILVDCKKLDLDEAGPEDCKALGWHLGPHIRDRIPVFINLPETLSIEKIKGLLYSVTVTGAPGLVHLAGITPEAPDPEAVIRGDGRSLPVLNPSPRDVARAFSTISTARDRALDLVIFGCPQCSIQEIQEIDRILGNRKIHENTRMWICTSAWVSLLCRRMGIRQRMQRCGVRIVSDVGAADGPYLYLKDQGVRVIAVNSARASYYAHTLFGMKTWFGSTADCVESAVRGSWEGRP